MDFFLGAYLKDKIFSTLPQHIDVSRQRITDTFDDLYDSRMGLLDLDEPYVLWSGVLNLVLTEM